MWVFVVDCFDKAFTDYNLPGWRGQSPALQIGMFVVDLEGSDMLWRQVLIAEIVAPLKLPTPTLY